MSEENKFNGFTVISIIATFILAFNMISKCNTNSKTSRQAAINDPYKIPESVLSEYHIKSESEYPDQVDSLVKVWDAISSSDTDPFIKIDLVSSPYKDKFRKLLRNALYLPADQFNLLQFQYRLEVVNFRKSLKAIFSEEELKEKTYDDILPEFIFVELGAFDVNSKLEKFKFESDSLAYGLFKLMGNYKSVQFVKEDHWRIHLLKEDPDFDISRTNLVRTRVREFGSEQGYMNIFLDGDNGLLNPIKGDTD